MVRGGSPPRTTPADADAQVTRDASIRQATAPTLSSLTNAQLKSEAVNFITVVRGFLLSFREDEAHFMIQATSDALPPDQKSEAERRYRDGMMQRVTDLRARYYRQYASRGVALYQELMRRVGEQHITSIRTMIFDSPEHFAGGDTVVFEGMRTLERLVDALPPGER